MTSGGSKSGRLPTWSVLAGVGVAGLAAAYLAARRSGIRAAQEGEFVGYPPLDTPKRVADSIWIVDSGPIRAMGLALPVRMTIVRLANGDLLLHSPTRFTRELAQEVETLGPVRHLVAPTIAHWMFLADWQEAFPDVLTWAAPGLRDRRQVRQAGVRLDFDLGEHAPEAWAAEIEQSIVSGAAGFHEVVFFHKPTRTLMLADLLQNLEPSKLPAPTRVAAKLSRGTVGTTPIYVRPLLKLRGSDAETTVRKMVALKPERVIFAHGEWFKQNAAERLRQGFDWLL